MKIMVFDPGFCTGWSFYDNGKYKDSGVIYLKKCIQPLKELQKKIYELLHKYQPDKVYMEKMYDFMRMGRGSQPLNTRAIQKHSQAWAIISNEVSFFGVPLIEIDTRKWAKKKTAQETARRITNKNKISTHEAEAVVWGHIVSKIRRYNNEDNQ